MTPPAAPAPSARKLLFVELDILAHEIAASSNRLDAALNPCFAHGRICVGGEENAMGDGSRGNIERKPARMGRISDRSGKGDLNDQC